MDMPKSVRDEVRASGRKLAEEWVSKHGTKQPHIEAIATGGIVWGGNRYRDVLDFLRKNYPALEIPELDDVPTTFPASLTRADGTPPRRDDFDPSSEDMEELDTENEAFVAEFQKGFVDAVRDHWGANKPQ